MTHTTDDRKKLAELIKDFRIAMFTTQDADGRRSAETTGSRSTAITPASSV